MFEKMQINGLEQEQPSSRAEREHVHSLHAGIDDLPVLAQPIEIAIDIKIEIVYVFEPKLIIFYWSARTSRVLSISGARFHRSVFGLGYEIRITDSYLNAYMRKIVRR